MEEKKVLGPEDQKQNLTSQDYDMIQQLIKRGVDGNQTIIYEDLQDYELPPRTQFSMLKKPAVTIKDGKFNFNMACIRLFEGVQYILPIVNAKKQRLAVIPCKEEKSSSIDWARQKQDGTWTNKQISNRDLVAKIGNMMNWTSDCRYKILGEIRMSSSGPILVFELSEAIMIDTQKEEIFDEETGEKKIKRKETKYYPEKYKGRIGMSYSDYAEARQMNLFEDFANYFSPDGASMEETVETDESNTSAAQSVTAVVPATQVDAACSATVAQTSTSLTASLTGGISGLPKNPSETSQFTSD